MSQKTSLLSLHEIFSKSWSLTQRKLGKLIVINSLAALVMLVIYGLLFGTIAFVFFMTTNSSPFEFLPWFMMNHFNSLTLGVFSLSLFLVSLPWHIVDGWAKVASYAVLAEEKPQPGWKYWWTNSSLSFMIGFSLVLKLIVIGGLFYLFIIPGVIGMLYFMFVTQVVTFEGKKFFSALDRSAQIVQHNFGKVLFSLIAPYVLIILLQGALMTFVSQLPEILILLSVPISILFQLVTSYFLFVYSYVLYRTASENTPLTEVKPHRVLVPLGIAGQFFGGFIIFALVLHFFGLDLASVPQKIFEQREQEVQTTSSSAVESYSQLVALSEEDALKLSQDVFEITNQRRANLQLPPLIVDDRLCHYATKRLNEIETLGKYDNGKGFNRDLDDKIVVADYFPQLEGYFQENYQELFSNATTAETLVEKWLLQTNSDNEIPYLTNSNNLVCIEATSHSIYSILVERKE